MSMNKWLLYASLTLLVLLLGCGEAVTQEELRKEECQGKICLNKETLNPMAVNGEPITGYLSSKTETTEYYNGFRISTSAGRKYQVLVTPSREATIHAYVSPTEIIDRDHNDLTDSYGGDWIHFTAETSTYYIVVLNVGKGGTYTLRVVSFEEGGAPLPGTTRLKIGIPVSIKLFPGEITRFSFNPLIGDDYIVKVSTSYGSTGTFLARIPCVDDVVFDQQDSNSYWGITFRAKTEQYYIGVVDRTTTSGSDSIIEVYQSR